MVITSSAAPDTYAAFPHPLVPAKPIADINVVAYGIKFKSSSSFSFCFFRLASLWFRTFTFKSLSLLSRFFLVHPLPLPHLSFLSLLVSFLEPVLLYWLWLCRFASSLVCLPPLQPNTELPLFSDPQTHYLLVHVTAWDPLSLSYLWYLHGVLQGFWSHTLLVVLDLLPLTYKLKAVAFSERINRFNLFNTLLVK